MNEKMLIGSRKIDFLPSFVNADIFPNGIVHLHIALQTAYFFMRKKLVNLELD